MVFKFSMMYPRLIILVLFSFSLLSPGFSQEKLKADTLDLSEVLDTVNEVEYRKVKWNTFAGLPIIYFLPETSFGFGAAGIYAFRFKKFGYEQRPSQVRFVTSYTVNGQLVTLFRYNLFLKNAAYNFRGELGYYRFSYEFYGVGNDATNEDEETFKVNFFRFRPEFFKQFNDNWYAGLTYGFEDYDVVQVLQGGILDEGGIKGNKGGTISNFGAGIIFDNRDNVFATHKGYYIELSALHNSPSFGSDFSFSRLTFDARTYITNKKYHTLALNAYSILHAGEPPFNELAFLGGSRRGRGYYPGRFRDRNLFIVQAEYRFPLFWYLGGVTFGSYGGVARNLNDFQLPNFRYNVGLGLRFAVNPADRINIRIDYAIGKETSGFYLTVGEAF